MLKSLLVPLDGSEFSERALPLACRLARTTGASLHLAHVHKAHPPEHFLSSTQFHYEGLDLGEYDAHHRDEERAYLEELTTHLEESTHADARLLEGPVAEGIAAYADEVDADLLLVVTHGRAGIRRLWLGSVADALVRSTHLPLLLLHPAPGSEVPQEVSWVDHILVPLDGSDLAAAILAPVREMARATGARVTLLHIVSSSAVIGTHILPMMPSDTLAAVERATAYLEKVVADLGEDGIEAEPLVVAHEVPAAAIQAVAAERGADLVAMATHGYGGLKRALLGSVASTVLAKSPLPLLLKRPA